VDQWTTHVTANLVVLCLGYFLVCQPLVERAEHFLGRYARAV